MQKTVLKWLLLFALLSYTAIAAVWAADRARNRACPGVEINVKRAGKGTTISESAIRTQIDRFDPQLSGKNVSQIRVSELEKSLSGFNNFESVECYISSSGKLCVDVVPMIPEIRVFDRDGSSYYINKDGKRIDARADFFVDVPIVSGRFSERWPASRVLPVVRYINKDKTLRQLVSMIEVRSPHDIILVPRIAGHVINIGDSRNLDEKFRNLMLMYRKVMPYKGWDTYDTISVKFSGQVVATRRDKRVANPIVVQDDDIELEEASLEGQIPEGAQITAPAHAPAQQNENPATD